MSKKILLILIISTFFTTGCEEKNIVESTIKDAGYQANQSKFICDSIKDAKSLSASNRLFLTKDNRLYKYDFNETFSNDQNCQEINYSNSEHPHSLLFNRLYNKDNNILYTFNNNVLIRPEEYNLKEENINFSFDFITTNYGTKEYLFIQNHHVYISDTLENDNNKILLFEIPADENIIGIFGTLIKTDKNYYNTYEKKYVKSSISDIYDDILFASQTFIIDKEGNLYEHEGFEEILIP